MSADRHPPAKASPRAADPARGEVDEREVLRAALRVFRHLDAAAQLDEMAATVAGWCGAAGSFALCPGGEAGGAFTFVPGTLAAGDPIRTAFEAEVPLGPPAPWPSQPVRLEGMEAWPAVAARWGSSGPASSILVPVSLPDRGSAALLVILDPAAAPLRSLASFAALTGPALVNAAKVLEVRDLTIKDDTAECFNRRYFEEFIVEEMARANRFRTPMSLIFFDMDNLKQVNTRLGHAMGSRTLKEVSLRVRAKVRRFDKLFRYGGDEFCIVLPETEWHGAMEVAERVRSAISGTPYHLDGAGEDGVAMTASFGIASFPLHARAKEDLVQRADRAMQAVKSATKNGIGIAELERDGHGA